MLIDLSVSDQTYIEDCEVCCCPIKIWYSVEGEEIRNFAADATDE